MTPNRQPLHVLIAGGGVAALEAMLALRALAEERVSISLVTPEPDFTYRPMSVGEPFRVSDVRRFPIRTLVESAGATLQHDAVGSVEPERHVVKTHGGETLGYDALLLALGARSRSAIPGALTFRGSQDAPAMSEILEEALLGSIESIAFALPAGATWPLPLYELALMTRSYLSDRGKVGVGLTIVTPEERPLSVFGHHASDAIEELLAIREIDVIVRRTALRVSEGVLDVAPNDRIQADRVVALPILEGTKVGGMPADARGFVPTDEYGRVVSIADVYAAGDMTQFPLKQGGIATQQADAAAASIAADAGVPVELEPFRPVLRGLLLTGMVPRYLRAQPGTGSSVVDTAPLWWPPAKIVGRYLAPFLAEHLGLAEAPPPPGVDVVQVDVELEAADHAQWSQV